MPYFQGGVRRTRNVRQSALSGFTDILKAPINIASDILKAQGANQAYASMSQQPNGGGGLPGWVVPVGIVAALGLTVYLVKRR